MLEEVVVAGAGAASGDMTEVPGSEDVEAIVEGARLL